jgi:outer membrane protein insertion porin family
MPVFAIETDKVAVMDFTPTSTVDTQSDSSKKIRNIEIEGTNLVRPEDISNMLQLQRGDTFDRNIIQTDLKNIYRTGFFSERMKAIPVDNLDGTITLKIVLEENSPITDYTISGNTVVSNDEIIPFMDSLVGKPQNIETINETIDKIQECYKAKGYILARVDSFYDDPDGTVNIHINEGEIDRIFISGNNKTKDYIISRNILTEAGTIYNENQIREDLVRLYATQSFKDVRRNIEPSERDSEKYDVTIEVEEQRTASLSVGGGLDTASGVFGSVGITDNNFRGLNQRVGLNGMVGSGVVMSDSSVLKHANMLTIL